MLKASISKVDSLIKNAVSKGVFPTEDAAAEALHEWLLYHEKHTGKYAVRREDATSDPADSLADTEFQLDIMRNLDA
ncbi:hypothetical protein BTA51_03140 [Hahella sp. CCB-MM4]|uniref:hypothetical protein n=1 Tax=Hahella sp. (strain CCB-MM4) TaxID=1926491 RepID=UPI000B9A4F6B|nr:hypothetical protein [Hahella sp. CCB-MM4]OZG75388.1 hypothetical protein BTA51_03140 [Hahella sp. CCB-MM4]